MGAAPLLPSDVEHTDDNILKAMEKLKYPVLATIKKDGIRAGRFNGTLLSRTRKQIPNKSIRDRSLILPGGFDMELWSPALDYNTIQSIVMSESHPDSDKIEFHVLDWFGAEGGYLSRMQKARTFIIENLPSEHRPPTWVLIKSSNELFSYFAEVESKNGEGICFRLPNSPYKQNRSTLREQYLVKLCRYIQSEATIIDFVEQYENTNPEEYNAIGRMDRSKSVEGMVPKNTLGAIVVQDTTTGIIYNVGSGFTDKQRKEIWLNKSKYIHKIALIKSKGHGVKEKPRSPIFKGLRNKIDIV